MKIFKDYFDYFIIFLLIYTSRETVLFGTNNDSTIALLGFCAPVIVLILLFFRKDKARGSNVFKYNDRSRDTAIIIIFMIIMTMVINLDLNVKYGYEILLCLIAYNIANQVVFERFARVYSDIMEFLSLFAIVTFVIYIIYPGIFGVFPVITNKSSLDYIFLGLSVLPKELLGVVLRMYGIFREPGVAIIFVNLALLFELFVINRSKSLRVSILVLTVGFSLSTAGFILTFLIILTYVLHSQKKHYLTTVVLLAFIFVLAFIILQNDFIYMAVFDKFNQSESSSTGARFGSVINNIKLVIDNPIGLIFGLGYQFVEDYFANLGGAARGEEHNTNTMLKELSIHGFLFFSFFLLKIFDFSKILFHKEYFCSILVFATIVLALSNEDLTVDIILYLIVFYSCKNKLYVQKRNDRTINPSYMF